MAARTAMGKIGKIDFFACLPSGAYAFLCLYLVFSIVSGLEDSERVTGDGKVAVSGKVADSKNTVDFNVIVDSKKTDNTGNEAKKNYDYDYDYDYGLWNAINQLIKKTSSEPTSLLLIIFSAYLLGSLFRALPVGWAEGNFDFKSTDPNESDKEFPYPKKINEQNNTIIKYIKDKEYFFPLEYPATTTVFNYWKEVLCINSPEGFVYYQEYEARTRFFSSIIFSAVFGALISLSILMFLDLPSSESFRSLLIILIISLIIIIFSLNMRRVRILEQQTLAGLYLAYIRGEEPRK